MERGNDWSARVARDIGRRVARYRKRADLTAVMLSARCAELGLPLDRGTIAKLENGHRNSVTVDEVYVLAAALGLPPVQLLFGVGYDETAEILPGRDVGAFPAARWFSGEAPIPSPGEEAYVASIADDWNFATDNPLAIYRAYEQALAEEARALALVKNLEAQVAVATSQAARDALMEAANARREVAELRRAAAAGYRQRAEHLGLLPPGPAPAMPPLAAGYDELSQRPEEK